MAVWYEVERTKEGIYNFMECNMRFHDFAISRVSYDPDENMAEIFLKYDELKDSVILRFLNVHSMSVAVNVDCRYICDISTMSALFLLENGDFLWIEDDGTWGEKAFDHIEELKEDSSWIQAERIIWAMTDEHGQPTELPARVIDQIWNVYGKIEHHHFDLMPYKE